MLLAAKEGLALLNGTQVSTALALKALFEIEDIFAAAVVSGALSVDAAKGSDTPFGLVVRPMQPRRRNPRLVRRKPRSRPRSPMSPRCKRVRPTPDTTACRAARWSAEQSSAATARR